MEPVYIYKGMPFPTIRVICLLLLQYTGITNTVAYHTRFVILQGDHMVHKTSSHVDSLCVLEKDNR